MILKIVTYMYIIKHTKSLGITRDWYALKSEKKTCCILRVFIFSPNVNIIVGLPRKKLTPPLEKAVEITWWEEGLTFTQSFNMSTFHLSREKE